MPEDRYKLQPHVLCGCLTVVDFMVLCEFMGFRSGVIACDLVGCDESSWTSRSQKMRPLCCHETSETKSPVISVLSEMVPDLSGA